LHSKCAQDIVHVVFTIPQPCAIPVLAYPQHRAICEHRIAIGQIEVLYVIVLASAHQLHRIAGELAPKAHLGRCAKPAASVIFYRARVRVRRVEVERPSHMAEALAAAVTDKCCRAHIYSFYPFGGL
jgi:fumarate reductase subunit D